MTMMAKAVRIDESTYESPSTRRKVDTDRLREIIERDDRNQDEPKNGDSPSSDQQKVST